MFLRRASKSHHDAVCLAPLLLLQKGIQLNNSEQILLCHIRETPKRQLPFLHAILDANGNPRHRRTACLRQPPRLLRYLIKGALLCRHLHDKGILRRLSLCPIANTVPQHLFQLLGSHCPRASRRIAVAIGIACVWTQQETEQERREIARRHPILQQKHIA